MRADADVQIGPIRDWCVVADCDTPFVCIVTANAWYRLATPAASYTDLFKSVAFKSRLCASAVRVLRAAPATLLPVLLTAVCKELMMKWGYQVALLSDVQVRISTGFFKLYSWTTHAR
jgi:hypothetical protein